MHGDCDDADLSMAVPQTADAAFQEEDIIDSSGDTKEAVRKLVKPSSMVFSLCAGGG
jgi:hypothetical protein